MEVSGRARLGIWNPQKDYIDLPRRPSPQTTSLDPFPVDESGFCCCNSITLPSSFSRTNPRSSHMVIAFFVVTIRNLERGGKDMSRQITWIGSSFTHTFNSNSNGNTGRDRARGRLVVSRGTVPMWSLRTDNKHGHRGAVSSFIYARSKMSDLAPSFSITCVVVFYMRTQCIRTWKISTQFSAATTRSKRFRSYPTTNTYVHVEVGLKIKSLPARSSAPTPVREPSRVPFRAASQDP